MTPSTASAQRRRTSEPLPGHEPAHRPARPRPGARASRGPVGRQQPAGTAAGPARPARRTPARPRPTSRAPSRPASTSTPAVARLKRRRRAAAGCGRSSQVERRRVVQHVGGHPQDLGPGRRRQQHRPAALGAAPDPQPGRDGQAPRAADRAQQQRLADLDAAQPPLLQAGRAGGQQAALDVQAAAAVPAQPEAPEGQHVAGRPTAARPPASDRAPATSSAGQPPRRRPPGALVAAWTTPIRSGCRCASLMIRQPKPTMNSAVNAPDRVNGPYAAQRGRSRAISVSVRLRGCQRSAAAQPAGSGGRARHRRAGAAARRAAPGPARAADAVDGERLLAPVGRPGADLDLGQPEGPLPDVRRSRRRSAPGPAASTSVRRRSSPRRSCSWVAVIR